MKKKVQAIFLQIQRWSSFSPKRHEQNIQKTLPHSPIEHQTTKTKSLRIRRPCHKLVHLRVDLLPNQEEKMIQYRLHCNYSSASRRRKPSFQWKTLLCIGPFWKIDGKGNPIIVKEFPPKATLSPVGYSIIGKRLFFSVIWTLGIEY
jgi:hypothetical protein